MLKANDFSLLVRMLLTTGAVLGVLLLFARFAKKGKLDGLLAKYGASRTGTNRNKTVATDATEVVLLSRTAIGRDQQLLCMSWHGETLLVCVGGAGATVLARHTTTINETTISETTINETGFGASTTGTGETPAETFEQTLAAVGGSLNSNWLDRLREATSRKDGAE